MVAECTWKVKVGTVGAETIVSNTDRPQRTATETRKEGFAITHLDPYNTFWDTSVPAAMLAEEGELQDTLNVNHHTTSPIPYLIAN